MNISGNLIFQNSSNLIELNDTLQFKNSNSSNSIQLRNSNLDWYLEPSTNNFVNFNLNFGGMSITADATFINLNGSVNVSNGININGGYIQQLSIGNPTSSNIESTKGTFYNNNGVPYFSYNNGIDVISQQLAPIDSPAFTGTPTAPTPDSQDNSQKLATTAFVQSIVGSPVLFFNYEYSSLGEVGASSTTWSIIMTAQPQSSPPPFGKTFSYTIYTDIDSPSYSPGTTPVQVQGLFGSMSGTGVYQPINYTTIGGITYSAWSYVLSAAISNVGLNLNYLKTELATGFSLFYITSSSTDSNLSTVYLNMVIRPNP